jgi:hypothetical protein
LLVYHWYEGSLGLIAETARALGALDASPLHLPEEIVVVRMATDVAAPVSVGLAEATGRLVGFYPALRRVLDHVQETPEISSGKRFPEFPRSERIFLDPSEGVYGTILVNQWLRSMRGLGMPLARWTGGAAKVRLTRGGSSGKQSGNGEEGNSSRSREIALGVDSHQGPQAG